MLVKSKCVYHVFTHHKHFIIFESHEWTTIPPQHYHATSTAVAIIWIYDKSDCSECTIFLQFSNIKWTESVERRVIEQTKKSNEAGELEYTRYQSSHQLEMEQHCGRPIWLKCVLFVQFDWQNNQTKKTYKIMIHWLECSLAISTVRHRSNYRVKQQSKIHCITIKLCSCKKMANWASRLIPINSGTIGKMINK